MPDTTVPPLIAHNRALVRQLLELRDTGHIYDVALAMDLPMQECLTKVQFWQEQVSALITFVDVAPLKWWVEEIDLNARP
jgi:hypothetical protein